MLDKIMKATGTDNAEKALEVLKQLRDKAEADGDVLGARNAKAQINEVEKTADVVSRIGVDNHKELQDLSDEVYIVSKLTGMDPRSTKAYNKLVDKVQRNKILYTESASANEWVPTQLSTQIFEDLAPAGTLLAELNTVQMPTNPYKIPMVTARPTAYHATEAATDTPDDLTVGNATPKDLTLDAEVIAINQPFSNELAEDAISPVLGMLRKIIAEALRDSITHAIINGDTDVSSSPIDSDLTAAADVRTVWLGVRHEAVAGNKKDLSTFSVATLSTLNGSMGHYGWNPKDLVWVGGSVVNTKLQALASTTAPQISYDPASGRILVFGSPFVRESRVREDLNASGVYDGATKTYTEILCLNKQAMVVGYRGGVTIDIEQVKRKRISYLIGEVRADFGIYNTEGIAIGYKVS